MRPRQESVWKALSSWFFEIARPVPLPDSKESVMFRLLNEVIPRGAPASIGRPPEADVRSSTALVRRGVESHARGDLDGALAAFEEALEVEPHSREAYNNRGA